jgi:tetratricopeptide (TPR) repeat protein
MVNLATDFGDVGLPEEASEFPAPPEAPKAPTGPAKDFSFVPSSQEPAGDTRYHVRRKSGKMFGPFDEATVVRMLEEGQLSGEEEVSNDQDSWTALTAHPSFAGHAPRARSAPTGNAPPPPVLGRTDAAPGRTSVERMNQLYEGRMATVAVAERGLAPNAFSTGLRKAVIPAIVAVVLLAIIGPGLWLGTTKYGVFGLHYLLPKKVSPGSTAARDLATAREDLLEDTYESYRDAKARAAHALKQDEYPEARAVWAQAVFYLSRRYADSTANELAAAQSALPEVALLSEKNPDVLKAEAGGALARRAYDEALAALHDAWAHPGAQPDLELGFLVAEAQAAKGQLKPAEATLKQLLAVKKSAKALHALGNAYQAEGQADLAEKAYQDALALDPKHANSALELAAVEILLHKDAGKGADAVEQALADKTQALGPAEQARAHALKGAALLLGYQPEKAEAELKTSLQLDKGSVFAKAMLAKAYFQERNLADALPLFQEAATKEPQNLEYTEGYLESMVGQGRMNDALQVVTAAAARFPGNARISFLNGQVDEALGHTADEENHYKRALEGDPNLVEAGVALSRFYTRSRRFADATKVIETLVQKSPENAELHGALGNLLVSQGDLDRAKSELDLCVTKMPSLPEAYLGLSRWATATGNMEEAKRQIDHALQLDAHLKEAHLQRGLVLWKLKDLTNAITELELAKAEAPTDPKVGISLGAVKLEANDLAGAETALIAVLGMDPSNPDANFYLSKVRDRRGLFAQAQDAIKAALDRAPKRPDLHFQLGQVLKDAKQNAEAEEEWKTAETLSPTNADYPEAMGDLYLEEGKLDLALTAYQRSMKNDPKRARVLLQMGDCYFQKTKWDDAIELYKKAQAMDATQVSAFYKIGRALSESGHPDKALPFFLKATEATKSDPMPYYYLAYAQKERKHHKEAILAFQKYLELKPNADDKKQIEDEIFDMQHER